MQRLRRGCAHVLRAALALFCVWVCRVGATAHARARTPGGDGGVGQSASSSPCGPQFLCGGSTRSAAEGFAALRKMGGTHVRLYMHWRFIQERVPVGPLDNITVDSLRANPKLVQEWAATVPKWDVLDDLMAKALNHSLQPIVEIGEGTTQALPQYRNTSFDPAVVGEDTYLAYMYRYCRAVVMRYKEHVDLWQTENELNEAWLESLSGVRVFNVSGPWRDWAFLTKLLRTLRSAVKDEVPSDRTTMNFHTDVPKSLHTLLGLPGYFEDAARAWAVTEKLMDIVAFDAYPNYVSPSPTRGDVLGNRTAVLINATGLEVFVMETNYPVNAPNNSHAPPIFDYTETRQANFLTSAFESVVAAGGSGFMVFSVCQAAGMQPPPGGYEAEDIQAFSLINQTMFSGNLEPGIKWALGHLDYVTTRLAVVASRSESWGLLGPSPSYKPRPAWWAMRKLFTGG